MNVNISRYACIEIRDVEIGIFLHVLRLAHARLAESPVLKYHGSPLEHQAGIAGHELFAVKRMISDLGRALGEYLPEDGGEQVVDASFPVTTESK
jgi:hypothetical protein